jgi:hypothetical protein
MSGPNREHHLGNRGPDYHCESMPTLRHGSRFDRPRGNDRTVSGMQALADATGDSSYDELAEPMKASITHKEWQWLSDREKARLLQSMTEPEVFDDGV